MFEIIWVFLGLVSAEIVRCNYSDLGVMKFLPYYVFFGFCGGISLLGVIIYSIFKEL